MSEQSKYVEFRILRSKTGSVWWEWGRFPDEQSARSELDLCRAADKKSKFRLVKRAVVEEVVG
jgi:hypothetical protein